MFNPQHLQLKGFKWKVMQKTLTEALGEWGAMRIDKIVLYKAPDSVETFCGGPTSDKPLPRPSLSSKSFLQCHGKGGAEGCINID